jgi:hypothetical protein
MREIGPASSDEMVLSFIRAEIDSPVWGVYYQRALDGLRFERSSLIDEADLKDSYANCVRGIILGAVRGYGRQDLLFRGFPSDTEWRRVSVDASDFRRLKYLNCSPFPDLSDGTREVEVGARNRDRDEDFAARVDGVVQAIARGASMPELILVEDAGRLVVLEGNTRATGYVRASTTSFLALVGSSPIMRQWVFI